MAKLTSVRDRVTKAIKSFSLEKAEEEKYFLTRQICTLPLKNPREGAFQVKIDYEKAE